MYRWVGAGVLRSVVLLDDVVVDASDGGGDKKGQDGGDDVMVLGLDGDVEEIKERQRIATQPAVGRVSRQFQLFGANV